MVAPRDYYADLELAPTAEVQEIKKQYRKLALKYHPDRNPGREREVNAQFLVIQTAHDVLTDPEQRAKYDASRTRAGSSRYPAASGVRGNPWADVGQQFPTPPRRNQPNRGAASGAERWNSRFASGVPPTARQHQHATANSESRKNAAKAFESMKPKTQAKASSSARPSAGAPPPTPPRTESARQRQQASFGARKTGYQPRASAFGDEPPVTNKNYTTRPDPPPRPDPKPAETAKPQQAHPTRVPDPLSQFRDKIGADDRQRSPYMGHSGEKTNPFDINPEPSRPAQEPPPTNAGLNASTDPRNEGKPSTNAAPPKPEKTPLEPQANGGPSPPIFTIPDDDDFAQAPPGRKNFTKNSVDDINTSFVNDGGRAAWEFSAGGGEHTQSGTSRPQSAGQDGRGSQSNPETVPQAEAANPQGQWAGTTNGAFHAEGWSDKFGPQTFVPHPRTPSTGSPSKTSRTSTRKPKATKPTSGESGHNAILIEDSSDEETFTWRGRKSHGGAATTDSPQAMDIDSPPPEPAPETPQPSGARNIPVEPSRPEWRTGDFAGVDGTKGKSAEPKPPVNPNAVGSEDSEEFKVNFADLRNVAPFASQGAGLKSFSELKDNLPFESKASGEIPIGSKTAAPRPLVFPDPPLAPRPPPTMGVPSVKTNLPAWEKYVQEFESYMRLWDIFTGQVTEHFGARKTQIATIRKEKGYGFLHARGDGDCLEYLKSVQQDNDVRRRWMAACDEHEQRLREFMSCREKMK